MQFIFIFNSKPRFVYITMK